MTGPDGEDYSARLIILELQFIPFKTTDGAGSAANNSAASQTSIKAWYVSAQFNAGMVDGQRGGEPKASLTIDAINNAHEIDEYNLQPADLGKICKGLYNL
ncbi:hypothetical protein [Massilia violaceinigra]|uniref:hypothetical protein n=1 Tax=Massilia violaceinigra TaxID=2045208 RepID=UPI001ABF19D5|nr:hypothetical protein [Massilia violaceinigra]